VDEAADRGKKRKRSIGTVFKGNRTCRRKAIGGEVAKISSKKGNGEKLLRCGEIHEVIRNPGLQGSIATGKKRGLFQNVRPRGGLGSVLANSEKGKKPFHQDGDVHPEGVERCCMETKGRSLLQVEEKKTFFRLKEYLGWGRGNKKSLWKKKKMKGVAGLS